VGDLSAVTAQWRDVIYKGNDNYFLEATSTNAAGLGRGRRWEHLRDRGVGGEHLDALATTLTGRRCGCTWNGVQASEPGGDRDAADLDQPAARSAGTACSGSSSGG